MPDQIYSTPESGTIPPPKTVAPGSGLPSHTAAGLACLFTLPSAIVFYFLDRRDPFVRLYAIQAMIWGAAGLMISKLFDLGIFFFLHIPLLGTLIVPLLNLFYSLFFLLWICGWGTMTVLAFMGKQLRVPPFVTILRRYLFPPR